MPKPKKSLIERLETALKLKGKLNIDFRWVKYGVASNSHHYLFFWDGNPPAIDTAPEKLRGDVIRMAVNRFPDCCGLTCVSQFDALSGFPKQTMSDVMEIVEAQVREHERVGGLVATLSDSQEDEKDMLLERGWQVVGDMGNPNSGHKVYVLYKQLVDPENTEDYEQNYDDY